jgi:hypothetical protein
MAKRDKGSDHGGLDAWFSGHGQGKSKAKGKAPWGDWVAITPVKKTVTKDDGDKKTYSPGDIVGPCGISSSPEWKDFTNNGKDPLKCMPRQKAHDMDKDERAELAKHKRNKEKSSPDGKTPVKTPTFGDQANKIKKKAYCGCGCDECVCTLPDKLLVIASSARKVAAAGFDDPWKVMSPEDRKEANRLFKLTMKAFPSSPKQKELSEQLQKILSKYGIGKKASDRMEKTSDAHKEFMEFYDLGYKTDHTNWGWYYYDKKNKRHGPFDTVDEMMADALKKNPK